MADRTCSVDGCERLSLSRGWCNKHYKRFLAHGDPLGTTYKPKGPCSVDGCEATSICREMCSTHYAQWRRTGGTGRICSIDGCAKAYFGHGWCEMHYDRWRSHGDPLVETIIVGDDVRRILSHFDRRGADDCWPWHSTLDSDGYGVIQLEGRQVKAHRWVYEREVGIIPDGLTLDHLCHTASVTCMEAAKCEHRRCVNPAHLEPVTNAENVRRARAQQQAARRQARQGDAA